MTDPSLGRLSDTLFWVTLAAYASAMVLYFAALAYRGKRAGSIATAIAWAGALVHIASVTTRAFAAGGRVPWGNMFEYSSMVGLGLVLVYLVVLDRRAGLRQVGGFVLGAAALSLAAAYAVYTEAQALQVALNSHWLKIHVLAAITGSMLFGLSFIFSVLFLFKERAESRTTIYSGSTVGAAYVGTKEGLPEDVEQEEESVRDDAGGVRGILGRLPSSSRLDALAYRTVQFAFPVWTFAVIAGAIWANVSWGRYWGWDPKETWAFVTWVMYAGYLHARSTSGWRGRRAAWLNVAGFGVVLFTYYGVNLLISGLHSYKNG